MGLRRERDGEKAGVDVGIECREDGNWIVDVISCLSFSSVQ